MMSANCICRRHFVQSKSSPVVSNVAVQNATCQCTHVSSLKNRKPTGAHTHQQLPSANSLSPLLNAVVFCVRDQPATHAPPSMQQTTSSRNPSHQLTRIPSTVLGAE